MTRSAPLILALLAFAALLLSLGAWAARRTHNASDFVLASRRLGVWLTAFGYATNVAPAWMLLLISAAAFTWGYAAVWLWGAALLGVVVNWFYVAPRLRALAAGQGATTVLQVLSADAGDRLQAAVARSIAFIAASMLLIQAGAALSAATGVLANEFGFPVGAMSVLCLAVVGACVFTGGVRGAAALDAVQATLLFTIAALLLAAAFVGIGGSRQLEFALRAADPSWTDPFAGKKAVVALAFAAGWLSLGLAMTGQPQALARFMPSKGEAVLRRARWAALVMLAALFAVVIAAGWAAHLLYAGLEQPEFSLVAIAARLLPPSLAHILIAGIVVAVASSAAGPLFTIATTFSVDLKRSGAPASFPWLKGAVLIGSLLALAIAVWAPGGFFEHSLFAFSTLGATLGPLLLVRLSGKRIRPGSMLGALWSAFALSLIFHLLPDSPGHFLERVLPFVAALGIALSGGERRRNPDRADRAEETVHDRVPI